jgi:hypothetical protein
MSRDEYTVEGHIAHELERIADALEALVAHFTK